MATIYDLSTGRVISENSGITTIEDYADIPEYKIALQPVQQTCSPIRRAPVDEYMTLIQELLKKL
ncbi:MAG TPA: hypothetical protein VET88_03355 [Gammaproteobacteria bacterium]|nr:hypothetical protein [Gammaproteobacteria bacterium]